MCSRIAEVYCIFVIDETYMLKFSVAILYEQHCLKNRVAQKHVVTLVADIFGRKKFYNEKYDILLPWKIKAPGIFYPSCVEDS